GIRAHHRRGADHDARLVRAPVGGPGDHERRAAGPVLLRRGQLHLLWRKAVDHPEPRRGPRRPTVRPAGTDAALGLMTVMARRPTADVAIHFFIPAWVAALRSR